MAPVGTTSEGTFTDIVTIDVPGGTSDGDLIIAHASSNDSADVVPEGTWTSLRSDLISGGTRVWVFYRTANNEPTSYDFTFSNEHWNFVILQTWRNYEITARHGATTSSSVTSLDFPQHSADNLDMLLLFGFNWLETQKSFSSGPTEVVHQLRGTIAGYEEQSAGTTPSHTVTADDSGDMAATSLLLAPVQIEETADPFSVTVSFDEPVDSVATSETADPFSVTVSFDEPVDSVATSETADPFSFDVSFDTSSGQILGTRVRVETLVTEIPDPLINTSIPSFLAPSTKIPSTKTRTIIPSMDPGPTSIPFLDVNTNLEE